MIGVASVVELATFQRERAAAGVDRSADGGEVGEDLVAAVQVERATVDEDGGGLTQAAAGAELQNALVNRRAAGIAIRRGQHEFACSGLHQGADARDRGGQRGGIGRAGGQRAGEGECAAGAGQIADGLAGVVERQIAAVDHHRTRRGEAAAIAHDEAASLNGRAAAERVVPGQRQGAAAQLL